MPTVPILMPQLGESIAEATVMRLGIAPGDTVQADQEVIEVETHKATMGVTTLCSGTVKEILVQEGITYAVGTVLGYLEVTEEEIARTGVDTREAFEDRRVAAAESPTQQQQEKNLHFALDDDSYEENPVVEPNVKGLPVPAGVMGAHYISPRMRARMNEMGLREADISAIAGTGVGGRVTVDDLEKFIDYINTWPSSNASPMRLAVADAMRRSWSRPLASV
ncbi:MAG: catalytic domain of component of various dehydrogenase complexe, partial [Akkermansiaceae bacterium]|nr:catalytic domain of component of various dehydrogenase complexe [Akkermansiaceae bacterium]